MSYRDDLDAAIARASAVTQDNAQLVEANRRLERELAEAREWLGGPRRRILVVLCVTALCFAMFAAGAFVIRSTSEPPVRIERVERVERVVPQVMGTIVADGPQLGRWTLNATRCVSHSDGIQLAAAGSDGHAIWLTSDGVEVEVPGGDYYLDSSECRGRLVRDVRRVDSQPPTLSGQVVLDCVFDGNSLQGRIEFKGCR